MTEEIICPFCKEKTSDSLRCSSCNGRLVRDFTFKGKKYPVQITYAERDWVSTDYYKRTILPLLKKRVGKTIGFEEIILKILMDDAIPKADRVTITGFRIFRNFDTYPVIQVWCRRGDNLFECTTRIAQEYGVYLHVTGPPLPRALISEWFDTHDGVNTHTRDFSLPRMDPREKRVSIKSIANAPNQVSTLLRIGNLRILLDAGFAWPEEGTASFERFIDSLKPNDIDLVILSHSHFDHMQGLMKLYTKYNCAAPIICTRASFELGVLRNAIYQKAKRNVVDELDAETGFRSLRHDEQHRRILQKISRPLDTKYSDLIKKLVLVNYGDTLSFGKFSIDFMQAGHYPGAIMTLFKLGNYSIMYTGDFNLLEFEPIASSRYALQRIRKRPNAVICDGSAADMQFPKEALTKARLYSEIMTTWRKKKPILILSDNNLGSIVTFFTIHQNIMKSAEGRIPFYFDETTWEQMCVLRERKNDLAISVQEKIENHLDPFHSVMLRGLESENAHLGGIGLSRAAKTPCVLNIDAILHGMIPNDKLSAIKTVLKDPDSLVIIVGAPRSNGTQDLISRRNHIEIRSQETKKYERIPVKCRVLNWDMPSHQLFNYHPDSDQLLEFFDYLMPEKVVFFHNNPNSLIDIRQKLSQRTYIKDHSVIHRYHPMIFLRSWKG